jgi:hypothetical protein
MRYGQLDITLSFEHGGDLHANCTEEDHYTNMEKIRDSHSEAEEYTDHSGPASTLSAIIHEMHLYSSIWSCVVQSQL